MVVFDRFDVRFILLLKSKIKHTELSLGNYFEHEWKYVAANHLRVSQWLAANSGENQTQILQCSKSGWITSLKFNKWSQRALEKVSNFEFCLLKQPENTFQWIDHVLQQTFDPLAALFHFNLLFEDTKKHILVVWASWFKTNTYEGKEGFTVVIQDRWLI